LGVNRERVALNKVPEQVRQAVLAAEDRTFYTEPGVSIRGTTRAFWSTLTGKQVQGGSTVTQQLVRNYYEGFSQERTVTRKLKEIMVSLKVGRERSKDWILEQYLNTIYLGRDAYGIQAAAKAYYDEDVGTLTTAQAAYLAAAIQQPTYFADPSGPRRALAEERWRYVLDGMVRRGAISCAEMAQMKFPQPRKQRPAQTYQGPTGYLINEAKRELLRRGYSEDAINRNGFHVVTTFDREMTKAATEAVKSSLPDKIGPTQTGLISVDPDSGEVKAMYGGSNYLDDQYDNVFDSKAQAGSGFKPYVLATALDEGMDLTTVVDGSSPQEFDGKDLRNDGNRSFGQINLVTATQNSVNTAYVNLGLKAGLDNVAETAENVGIPRTQLTANGVDKAPTLSLGAASVSPAQQAGGYATFAAEGVQHKPHVIREVIDPRGGKPRTFRDEGTEVFDKQIARDATYAMTKVVESGTGTGARLPDGRPVAGKTGTTDQGKAIWFNGFVPQLTTVVAMFRDDNKPLRIPGYSAYGGELPARIWREYMTEAMKGERPEEFGSPSDEIPRETPTPEPTPSKTEPTKEPSATPSPTMPTIEPPTPTKPTIEPPTPTLPPDRHRILTSRLAGRRVPPRRG
jgi:membrane peptidoglycan carboxypeptidase